MFWNNKKKEIMKALTSKDEPATVNEISIDLDQPYSTIYSNLETMQKHGEVEKMYNERNGRVAYKLTEKGALGEQKEDDDEETNVTVQNNVKVEQNEEQD